MKRLLLSLLAVLIFCSGQMCGGPPTPVEEDEPSHPISPNGSMATSKWFTGETPPDASMGVDGDLYLNTVSSAVYVKKDGSWISVAELRGPAGPAGLEKRYADYGTTGNKIAYTYTAEGKLASPPGRGAAAAATSRPMTTTPTPAT